MALKKYWYPYRKCFGAVFQAAVKWFGVRLKLSWFGLTKNSEHVNRFVSNRDSWAGSNFEANQKPNQAIELNHPHSSHHQLFFRYRNQLCHSNSTRTELAADGEDPHRVGKQVRGKSIGASLTAWSLLRYGEPSGFIGQ